MLVLLLTPPFFTTYINEHLKRYKLLHPEGRRQTDNGSEYCGSWSATKPSAYTLTVESAGQIHQTIPEGIHRFQSDIEEVT